MALGEQTEAKRLEGLWTGNFGEEYTRRNSEVTPSAGTFHHALGKRLGAYRVLEVGCNVGVNLTLMAADRDFTVAGIDINQYALQEARHRLPRVILLRATAYHLPFSDKSFNLVFTCGVLIHIPPESLNDVIREIHRVSRKWIWCGEYFSEELTEVPYRGEKAALYKCDFGARYLNVLPDLKLIHRGTLAKESTGFDNLETWLFKKG
jgi:pseudaminic acid biosynthesis-associated methylase